MSLLLQLTLFLAAALFMVPLFKRLGIATALGYLITGMLLSPLIASLDGNELVVAQLSQYSMILLMFFTGLVLRPQRLVQLSSQIWTQSSAYLIIIGGFFSLLCSLAFAASLSAYLVAGFAFALSSTAMVSVFLTQNQQLNTNQGQQAISLLLIQDLLLIALLIAIPLLAGPSTAQHGLAYVALVIAVFSGMFIFSRYAMRPIFRYVSVNGSTELLPAVALFIAFAVVLVMQAIGLSPILAAFIVGLMLADSEFYHELEDNIRPFKAILIGMFFMAVGLTLPLELIFSSPVLIIGGALILILSKLIGLALISHYAGYAWQTSLRLGAMLAQGSEFAFILFFVAVNYQVMSLDVAQPLLLIVALSLLLAPICLKLCQHLMRYYHPNVADNDSSLPPSPVVIAGFGQFGQNVARLLCLHGIAYTVIERKPIEADFLKQYHSQLLNADVSDLKILQQRAKVGYAKLFILTVDDVEASLTAARHMRLHFPQVKVLARAKNRQHAHDLKALGVNDVWMDNQKSAFALCFQGLVQLGWPVAALQRQFNSFSAYDDAMITDGVDDLNLPESADMMQASLAELESLLENDQYFAAQWRDEDGA